MLIHVIAAGSYKFSLINRKMRQPLIYLHLYLTHSRKSLPAPAFSMLPDPKHT